MSSQNPSRLLYLSSGDTTHDRRFLALAVEQGWAPFWLRCDGGHLPLDEPPIPNKVVLTDWLGSVEPLTDANFRPFVQAFRETGARIDPGLIQAGPVPTAGFVAVSAGVAPVLLTAWGSDLLVDVQSKETRARAVSALKGASRLLVDCQTVALAAMALGAEVDQTAIIPWGVDLQSFAYAAPRVSPGRFRLLSLRSLEPLYDIGTLLRGFALATRSATDGDLTLTIAGSGSEERRLRELAETLGISRAVHWPGRVPEGRVATLLRDHDVHVSTALSDGSALSLLEALAVGRPSIVPDLPSNREWITPGVTGWVFAPGRADGLAHAILHAVSERTDLEAMAERGRALVERRANWAENSRLIANLYREIAQ